MRFLGTLLLFALSTSIVAQSTLDQQVDSIVGLMDINEKIDQLINNGFMTTPGNSELNVPGFVMNDGPHGPRFDPSVSFPVGVAITSSFDRDLAYRVGKAMGEEFWGWNKDVQLGPCIDLCRDPRNGRSAETGGEDPYLAGEIGGQVIMGIQSNPVIATTKHYNGVNKQDYRHHSYVEISERNLMEHYGLNFQKAVQSGSMAFMSAYNLINNEKSAQSYTLLTTILRERWGYPFFVMSDWGGIWDSELAIKAGNDLCMGSDDYRDDLYNLWDAGTVDESYITQAAKNVVRTKMLSGMMDDNRPVGSTSESVNTLEHQQLCREAGQKAMILLKNQDNILPLNASVGQKILMVGPSANKAQLDGFGSAWVEATYTVSPRQGVINKIGESLVDYTFGCPIREQDLTDFDNAKAKAAEADIVIFVGGLDDTMEGEGYGAGGDRKNGTVDLPQVQTWLINELAAVNPNIIVTINSGGICAVNDFVDNIKGLIYAFYPGQEGGNALADVLFGDYNPAGRLPVTMPTGDDQIQEENDNFNDDYLTGYRRYDALNITPEYAFGFGLSYTQFTYSNIRLTASNPLTVSVDITNSGAVDGEEVAQLYMTDQSASFTMPEKQLKGFERISIATGQTQTVNFTLSPADFYYWNEQTHTYAIEAGDFTVKIGGSSDDLPLQLTVNPQAYLNQPDLAISQVFTLPRYPVEGQKVAVYALVTNHGDIATNESTTHVVEASINNHTISGTWTGSLPAGGSKLITLNTNTWGAVDGEFELVCTIDPNSQIGESIESNNGHSRVLKVGSNVPDLGDNLALNKPSWATTEEDDNVAASGNDGSYSTRWSSIWEDDQTFTVDLEAIYDLHTLKLVWETAFASNYTIDVAFDQTAYEQDEWTNAVTVNGFFGGIVNHEVDVSGRYLRVHCVTRATEWGNSFYEFEAYGEPYNANKLRLDRESVKLGVGQTLQLFATQENVTWESYIPGIVSVNGNGILTGVSTGQTQVLARSQDGSEVAICNVEVIADHFLNPDCDDQGNYAAPVKMEAECYASMSGIEHENCTDVGGGENLAYIDPDDWFEYTIDVPEAGNYELGIRHAGFAPTGSMNVLIDGNLLTDVSFQATGGWQTWETSTATLYLEAGTQIIRFVANNAEYNLNWFELSGDTDVETQRPETQPRPELSIFPNPAADSVQLTNYQLDDQDFQVTNPAGQTVIQISIPAGQSQLLDCSTYGAGVYTVHQGGMQTGQFVVTQ